MVNETPPPPLPPKGMRTVPPALPPRPVPVISQPPPPSHPPSIHMRDPLLFRTNNQGGQEDQLPAHLAHLQKDVRYINLLPRMRHLSSRSLYQQIWSNDLL